MQLTLISNRLQLERYILANGHLQLEGDESTVELREALLYLRQHTLSHCQHPELGTPIGVIVPDITELTGTSTGRPKKMPVEKVKWPNSRSSYL